MLRDRGRFCLFSATLKIILDLRIWKDDYMRMGDKAKAESIGAMLARLRWSKATEAERKAQGKKMTAGRKRARAKRGTK